jgi:hypothetical protein
MFSSIIESDTICDSEVSFTSREFINSAPTDPTTEDSIQAVIA